MICVFENGAVVERGTHKELIDMDGAYKTLISRQLTNQAGGSPSKLNSATPVKEKEIPALNEVSETKTKDEPFTLKKEESDVKLMSEDPTSPETK